MFFIKTKEKKGKQRLEFLMVFMKIEDQNNMLWLKLLNGLECLNF